MKNPSEISHPLIDRTGTSQRTRVIDALSTNAAPIDGKTLADRLYIISKYALQINHYEYIEESEPFSESEDIDNWNSFFKNSLPIQLALTGKISISEIEADYTVLYEELRDNPSQQALESILIFILNRFITPVQVLFSSADLEKNSYTTSLLRIIQSSFKEPLKSFIKVYNASATFLCVPKMNFMGFMSLPWQINPIDIHALDTCIQQSKKGKKEGYVIAGESVNLIFYQLLTGIQDVIETAPDFIEEALRPLEELLQKRHQPHLGLLFTFLELFNNLQVNINDLGKKHLDFFYQHVLKIDPRKAVPDKAHIVFEIAKHLDAYLLKENLLLKNGKDSNNEDIAFGLDHEIIIDKAQIAEVRTLSLNKLKENQCIEGVYVAPIANSIDGLGGKFKKDEPTNWSTLGSKFSKNTKEGNFTPDEHPKARLGLVLSSPVLLLQEGKRDIKVFLNCNVISEEGTPDLSQGEIDTLFDKLTFGDKRIIYYLNNQVLEECDLGLQAKRYISRLLTKQNPYPIEAEHLDVFLSAIDAVSCIPIFEDDDKNSLKRCFENIDSAKEEIETPLFKVWLSGEKEWIPRIPKVKKNKPQLSTDNVLDWQVQFELDILLSPDDPAVTFYDEEKLKEKLDLKKNLPVLKIEINEEAGILCDPVDDPTNGCYLKHPRDTSVDLRASAYEILRKLKLVNAEIDVKVCGVKQLIVQNDEGALDINSQMFPFGLRPEVPGFDPMNQILTTPDPSPDPDPDPDIPVDPESLLGPSFYVGSKEVLFKKWNAVRVNIEWKEKPNNFNDHYKAYLKRPNDIDETEIQLENLGLNEQDFKIKIDSLEDGVWEERENRKELFGKTTDGFGELECDTLTYGWEVLNKANDTFVDFDQELDFFKNSQNGFLKFTLADQDFLHTEYPFVLARQMLAYALTGQEDSAKLTDAIYITSNKIIIRAVDDLQIEGDGISESLGKAIQASGQLSGVVADLEAYVKTNETEINEIITGLNDLIKEINDCIEDNFEQFKIDLENFKNADLDGLNGFLTTLAEIRDELFSRNDPQLNDKVNEIEDTMVALFNSLNEELLNKPAPDGILGVINDIITELGNADPDTNSLLGPANSVKSGIEELIDLIDKANNPIVVGSLRGKINAVYDFIVGTGEYIQNEFNPFITNLEGYITDPIMKVITDLVERFNDINTKFQTFKGELNQKGIDIDQEFNEFITELLKRLGEDGDLVTIATTISDGLLNIEEIFEKSDILSFFDKDGSQALIPSEPWTPAIKNLYVDYTASATKSDIGIIHLYPFDNTSRHEDIQQNPSLFPILIDDGTLFIGIENLTPGGTLSILFQLAEATANSEMERAEINWHYLSNNKWVELLPDFNIISDETDGFTVSGIITIAVPDDINKIGNTLMPDDLYWIKASAVENAMAVAETIGIHTQAAKASARLSELNDTSRLNTALESGSISKLAEGDFSVKKIEQPYPSFDGRQPEETGHFYTRVSEHLKHKGRGLMLNDYEKIVLEGFPSIYKVKCISHTMGLSALQYRNDLEVAPGYVVITVIPDLTKLMSGNQLEPKVPVSLLEKIGSHLRKKISPFARIKVMNPRYEPVDVTICVRLYPGKSENFYQQKLQEDITNLLAPWFLGDSEKIAFGMPVIFSDIVGFVEQLDYVDFITKLELSRDGGAIKSEITPRTARSILTAGQICVDIDKEDCPSENDSGNNPSLESVTSNELSELG
ncbi:hypothetical protein U6A24_08055 [Aquimarina gracilis]|uniref:Baseplate J-like protein n=1 Tax=Aquimarina gracilis TaxID=874422 RepID=A0ABU5ZVD9_9FLAO|nr:hypothetical protein [Aquimarina gracilis]MEB3345406.1 hypothetical protein [Aquimarina gracilis]